MGEARAARLPSGSTGAVMRVAEATSMPIGSGKGVMGVAQCLSRGRRLRILTLSYKFKNTLKQELQLIVIVIEQVLIILDYTSYIIIVP